MPELTLYESLGGRPTLERCVADFYDRVLADRRLGPFFEQMEMAHQLDQMIAFLTMALGGPDHYSGRSMHEAHREAVEQGLGEQHFNFVIEHFEAAFEAGGVAQKDAVRIQAIVSMLRRDILGE